MSLMKILFNVQLPVPELGSSSEFRKIWRRRCPEDRA